MTFLLTDSAKTLEVYPFPFELRAHSRKDSLRISPILRFSPSYSAKNAASTRAHSS